MLTKFNFLKDKIIEEKDATLKVSVLFVDSDNKKGFISHKDIEKLCELTNFVQFTVVDTLMDRKDPKAFTTCRLSSLTYSDLLKIKNELDDNEICYITAKVSTESNTESNIQRITTENYNKLMSIAHFSSKTKSESQPTKPKVVESDDSLEIPV